MDSRLGPEADEERRDLRHEVKLIGEAALEHGLRSRLALHPVGLRKSYPSRRVNSLYFDTYEERALEDNLAGLARREKLRFRWYGDAVRGVRGHLERKVRDNLLGWKEHEPVERALDVEGARGAAFVRELQAVVSPGWREDLAHVLVAQWITYRRDYLATRDGRLRVTIDTGLTAYDQRERLRLSSRWRTLIPEVVVVELKASIPASHLIEEVLADMPVVVDRCSKFVLASSPENGPLRAISPI